MRKILAAFLTNLSIKLLGYAGQLDTMTVRLIMVDIVKAAKKMEAEQ